MSRIPWSRYSGDDIEHVIAVMLCRENPSATMIRPSQGDRGFDVRVPADDGTGRIDVYQVKRFAANLSNSQLGQVKRSLDRIAGSDEAAAGRIRNLYLTMPLNPTPENLAWLEERCPPAVSESYDVVHFVEPDVDAIPPLSLGWRAR